MIGQSINHVKSGGPFSRLSSLPQGRIPATDVVFLAYWLKQIPMAALVGSDDHGVHRHFFGIRCAT